MSKPPVMLIAEARMAVQYLERAESWAAGLDEEIVAGMVLVHRQLLRKIEQFLLPRGTGKALIPDDRRGDALRELPQSGAGFQRSGADQTGGA